jgi:hypothetical protein
MLDNILIIRQYRQVTNNSVIAVQVFDQKKFKKKDQGFLGVINVQVGSVFDIEVGGDGNCYMITTYVGYYLLLFD